MKLALIGGGGFRVPLVIEAASQADAPVRLDELALYDTDASRLATVRAVAAGIDAPAAPKLTWTTDLEEALRDADFVFCSIRVGGLAGRVADERVALDLGVLGQETVGPGGLAYALRTIPVMRDIAETIKRVAPNAYLINFTNPAGMVTEATAEILGSRVVGICDTPIGLLRRVQRLTPEPVTSFDYVGLNHLGWLRTVNTASGDVLPGILASDDALTAIEEARLVGFDWVRAVGALPNEYLYYYYFTREAVARILGGGQTRGEFLTTTQDAFFSNAANHPETASTLWHATVHEREATYMAESRAIGAGDERAEEDLGGGYQGVALAIMRALATGEPTTLILNVRNTRDDGAPVVPGLPADAVVEVPCDVDDAGIHPRQVAAPTGAMLGLLQSVKASEQLAIAAARDGSATSAWQSFAAHPLVDSVQVARQLLAGYRTAHPGLAYLR